MPSCKPTDYSQGIEATTLPTSPNWRWNAGDDEFMLPAPDRRFEPLPEQDRV